MADIEKLDEKFDALPLLLRMQKTCRDFLTIAEVIPELRYDIPPPSRRVEKFLTALEELRDEFREDMSLLRGKYGIQEGPTPEDHNPFIGKPIRTIYVRPPSWADQPGDGSGASED